MAARALASASAPARAPLWARAEPAPPPARVPAPPAPAATAPPSAALAAGVGGDAGESGAGGKGSSSASSSAWRRRPPRLAVTSKRRGRAVPWRRSRRRPVRASHLLRRLGGGGASFDSDERVACRGNARPRRRQGAKDPRRRRGARPRGGARRRPIIAALAAPRTADCEVEGDGSLHEIGRRTASCEVAGRGGGGGASGGARDFSSRSASSSLTRRDEMS